MKVNAAKDVDCAAHPHTNPPRVSIRFGWQWYTATAEEAIELARQLIAAAEAVDHAK